MLGGYIMKRILIIHSVEGKLKEIAQAIAKGAEAKGNQVDVISTKDTGKVVTFLPYNLILVGSPAKGVVKGKIAEDISPFLRQCKRAAGKEAIAFVTPNGLATDKALKVLMSELEKLGCFVNDFRTISNERAAVAFGENL